jgi:hypothetical protein
VAIVLPTSLFAEDSDRAMLYSGGTVSLNGSASPASSVIFSGDLIQTTAGSVAKINALGSSLIVLADSQVQFESNAVTLQMEEWLSRLQKGWQLTRVTLRLRPWPVCGHSSMSLIWMARFRSLQEKAI